MELFEQQSDNRTERKKEETKSKIIAVAMELFRKQGFQSTSMEQIALVADIARKTLYNHFRVKEDILEEYVLRELAEKKPMLYKALEELPDTRSKLLMVLNESFNWSAANLNPELIQVFATSHLRNTVKAAKEGVPPKSDFNRILVQIIKEGQARGEVRQDQSPEFLASHLQFLHLITVYGWVEHPEGLSPERGLELNVTIFLDGAKGQ